MTILLIFNPSGPYTVEFVGGPNDGGFATVPGDWPDVVKFAPEDSDNVVIYERDEYEPQRYRFKGWDGQCG